MSKNKNKSGKFILGAAVGAVLGVLFAPKTGKETRLMVKEKATDLINKAKELEKEEVREEIEQKVNNIISELKDLDKEKALAIATKQAEELKKQAENLVKYAKEKATPIVEEKAEVLREKAITATEKVLEKLQSKK